MSDMPGGTPGDRVELGALLVLVHGVDAPVRSVHASYQIWRHQERLREAFVADTEEQKRLGASVSTSSFYGSESDEPEPAEREETVRIWRDSERFREEHHGGDRDGYYAVADGPLWWTWDQRMGAMSNQDDASVGSGVGQELEVMLNPAPLLSSLRFRVTGTLRCPGEPPSQLTPCLASTIRATGDRSNCTNLAPAPTTTSSRLTKNAECSLTSPRYVTSSRSTRSPRSRSGSTRRSQPTPFSSLRRGRRGPADST